MAEWLDMLEENLRKSCWIIVYPDYQGYRAIPYRSFEAALKTLQEQCECGVYAVMLQKGVICLERQKYSLPLRVQIDEDTYSSLVRMCEQLGITFSKATRMILKYYFTKVANYENDKIAFKREL